MGQKKRPGKSRAKTGPKPAAQDSSNIGPNPIDCPTTLRTPRRVVRKIALKKSPGPLTRSQLAMSQFGGEGTSFNLTTPTRTSKRQKALPSDASPGPLTRRRLAMSQS